MHRHRLDEIGVHPVVRSARTAGQGEALLSRSKGVQHVHVLRLHSSSSRPAAKCVPVVNVAAPDLPTWGQALPRPLCCLAVRRIVHVMSVYCY